MRLITLLQGYNGSQLWDTAFAVQAIVSTDLAEEYGPTIRKAHDYIKNSQVLSTRSHFYYLQQSWSSLLDQQ